MIGLDDAPVQVPVVTRLFDLTSDWRRWLFRLVLLARISVVTLGGWSARVTATIGATWLQSSDTLPAGLFRVTVSAQAVSGAGATSVDVLFDEAGVVETVALVPAVGAITTTGVTVRRLTAGSRIGYQVTVVGAHTTDVDLVVEALPASTRLG